MRKILRLPPVDPAPCHEGVTCDMWQVHHPDHHHLGPDPIFRSGSWPSGWCEPRDPGNTTNQRPVSRSRDLSWPIRAPGLGQHNLEPGDLRCYSARLLQIAGANTGGWYSASTNGLFEQKISTFYQLFSAQNANFSIHNHYALRKTIHPWPGARHYGG